MSSRSLNRVTLIGNLTRDPELRYTPQGTPVCTFGMATNRSWVPSAGGERQEETEFHRVVAWNKLAELCNELLFKGRKVYVEGRIQTRNWTTAEGQERTTVEIVIDSMIVLDNRRKEGGAEEGVEYETEYVDEVSDEPTVEEKATVPADEEAGTKEVKPSKAAKKQTDKPKKADKKEEEVNPDDIPF